MGTLAPPVPTAGTWTNIQGLAGLAGAARRNSQAALPEAARQFEAVFTQMLIKSMRSASMGGGILDSQQSQQWRDIFDNQIALSMANDGKGLGIAAMLMRQLGGGADAGKLTSADVAALTPSLRALRTLGGVPLSSLAPKPAPGDASPANGVTAAANAGASRGTLDQAMDAIRSAGTSAWQAARQWAFTGPEDFVRKLAPYARAAADKLGVSVRAVLAQAALETGWGQHMPKEANGQSSFNLFGIKAGGGWDGARVRVPTVEYRDGVAVRGTAAFRAYAGPARSFADYARLLSDNPRYSSALGKGDNVAGFAAALHRAGYATDPAYAAKLTAIANGEPMRAALAALKNPAEAPTLDL